MNYKEIFKEILSVIENDYSGYQDKLHLDKREYYKTLINEDLTEEEFFDIVTLYLKEFRDFHLGISTKRSFVNGFSVRRYKDSLFVTNVTSEKGLNLGDEIIKINNKDIKSIEKEYKVWLDSDIPERQNFSEVLKKNDYVTLLKNGTEVEFKLNKYEPVRENITYEFKIKEGIPYLKLSDFDDSNKIHKLISDNLETILNNDYLIIDVRVNSGGSDLSYFPMLDFIFPKKTGYSSLYGNYSMAFLYSKRNCDLRIKLFEEYLESDQPEEVVKYLKNEIEKHKRFYGKGFLKRIKPKEGEKLVKEGHEHYIKGSLTPKHIYVLTDKFCGSSGDSFIYLVKQSSKVTVVGRNTMGVLDYSNVATYKTDNFTLYYPTSKMDWVDDGKGIDYIGIEPDVYIPFTPEHIEKDIDFNWVLEDIKQKANNNK